MRRAQLIVVAATTAGLVLPTLAQARTTEARTKKKAPVSQAAVAKRLAGGLKVAKTPRARERAVLAIMRALHVPVVTEKGKPLVVSAELNAARRFALYSFELRGLGAVVARGQREGLDAVSARLAKLDIKLDETRALPPELLRDGLVSAVRAARRAQRVESSLSALLIRELGLRAPKAYDLAKNPPVSSISLDPLQAYLIEADLAVSHLRFLQGPRRSGPRVARAAGVTGACAELVKATEELEKDIKEASEELAGGELQGWVGRYAIGKIADKVKDQFLKKAKWQLKRLPRWAVKKYVQGSKALARANVILEALHDMLMAYSVDVRALDENLETHWGHDGPGTVIEFRILVRVLDDYGNPLIKCGKLVGFEVPPAGPLKGVTVVWEQVQTQLAPTEGKLDCAVICTSTTGDDGIARLKFTPNTETIPSVGLERVQTGVVNGLAFYQSATGGSTKIGKIAQFLTPKFGGTRWHVGSHQPRLVLRITGSEEDVSTFCNSRGFSSFAGEIPISVAPDGTTTGTGAIPFAPGSTVLDCDLESDPSVRAAVPGSVEIMSLRKTDPPDPAKAPITITFSVISPLLQITCCSGVNYERRPAFDEAVIQLDFNETQVGGNGRPTSPLLATSAAWPRGNGVVVASREYSYDVGLEGPCTPQQCRHVKLKFEIVDTSI